jgi:hypothetical protein
MLIAGLPYDDIGEQMRVGKTTIARVHRWLHDQFPGFENAITEMEREFDSRRQKHDERYLFATSALFRLKKKHPMHFLLFPTPKATSGKRELYPKRNRQ